MFTLAGRLVHHLLPAVIRPVRILWNQLIGFIFLVLATFVGMATWQRTASEGPALLTIVAGAGFSVFLAAYGIASFWRARKISRS